MGRFKGVVDDIHRQRELRNERNRQTKQTRRDAVTPLAEKLAPYFRDATEDLAPLRIGIDRESPLTFVEVPNREYLHFRLVRPDNIPTSFLRFSIDVRTQRVFIERHVPEGPTETRFEGPLDKLNNEVLDPIFTEAIQEATRETD
jgi:hypothetical protein